MPSRKEARRRIGPLFDHLIRPQQQRGRDREAEGQALQAEENSPGRSSWFAARRHAHVRVTSD
jgi:hypothetical protein